MTRRLRPLPLLAVAGVLVLAGCGGGGSSSSTTSTSTGTGTVPANLQRAVTECHQLIEQQQKLSATAKEKLSRACDKAGEGDSQAVKQAAREVCEEVVEKAPLPASSKETALKSCRK